MKRTRRMAWLAGILAFGVSASQSYAQVPAVPAAAAPALAAAPAAAPAAAQGGFFKRICDALEECKRKICKTPAGALLNNISKPLTMATGGIIPPFCPLMPNDKDLAQPGVGGAAAAGKKDALEAAARRENVRFLGTLDCRYFPDAAKALAAALRADANECVRFEAALVLGRGCCCTQLTIDALEACVSGMDTDGNPAERSPRVRCAAAAALEKCLSCYVAPPTEPEPVKPDDKDKDKTKDDKGDKTTKKLGAGSRMPSPESVARARLTMISFNEAYAQARASMPAQNSPTVMLPKGRQSVFEIIKATAVDPSQPQQTIQPAVHKQELKLPTALMTPTPTPTPVLTPTPVPTPMPSTPATKIESYSVPMSTVPSTPATKVESYSTPTLMTTPPVTTVPAVEAVVVTPPVVVVPKVVIASPVVAPPTVVDDAPPMAITPAKTTKVTERGNPVVKTNTTSKPSEIKPTTAVQPASAEVNDEVVNMARKVIQGSTAADRHAAIRQIVRFDWKANPMVASALIMGAKTDKEAVVRVDCIRHLAAHKVNHPQVISDLQAIAAEGDSWVKAEATLALTKLKSVE